MRPYAQDRYHVFKRELKNFNYRLANTEYLEKTGQTELLSVERDILECVMEILERIEDACAKYYLFEIYILKRISLRDASLECGYKNPSAFIKMMKKSVDSVLTDEVVEEYLRLSEQEEKLLKEGLSEIH